MALPRHISHFSVFINGNNYYGEVSEVALPAINKVKEDARPGGFNAPVKPNLGYEALELEATYLGIVVELRRDFGGTGGLNGKNIRFAGNVKDSLTGENGNLEVIMRGDHTSMDPINAKAGEVGELKVKTDLTYYEEIYNGETIIKIDIINNIWQFGDEDEMAEVRRNLGM